MRFASEGSKFCLPEVSGGILPSGGGTTRLAMTAGPARAREIILSGRDFSGQEAADYGIVNRALGTGDLNSYVDDLAQRIAKRPAAAVAAVNEVFKSISSGVIDALLAGFAAENDALRNLMGNPAAASGLQQMAALQTVETERDLPGAIAAAQ